MSKRKMVSGTVNSSSISKICGRSRRTSTHFDTPEQIADGMQEWFDYKAADGYHLLSNII